MDLAVMQPQRISRLARKTPNRPLIGHGTVHGLGQDAFELQVLPLERKERRALGPLPRRPHLQGEDSRKPWLGTILPDRANQSTERK